MSVRRVLRPTGEAGHYFLDANGSWTMTLVRMRFPVNGGLRQRVLKGSTSGHLGSLITSKPYSTRAGIPMADQRLGSVGAVSFARPYRRSGACRLGGGDGKIAAFMWSTRLRGEPSFFRGSSSSRWDQKK